MDYIEFQCVVKPLPEAADMAMAILAEEGFESFSETDKGFLAYIPEKDFTGKLQDEINAGLISDYALTVNWKVVPSQNWNAVWESEYEPVNIENRCLVLAPFHSITTPVPYKIIIEPKMSFGTAHHETTRLMIRYLLDMDIAGKKVLDMGCGTAVLAILASMRGAASVDAIDNDEWAYNNSIENVEQNVPGKINVFLGDAAILVGKTYDFIIANINRNILTNDLESYAACLPSQGILLMSGFYKDDIPVIDEVAGKFALSLLSTRDENKWAAVCYQKG